MDGGGAAVLIGVVVLAAIVIGLINLAAAYAGWVFGGIIALCIAGFVYNGIRQYLLDRRQQRDFLRQREATRQAHADDYETKRRRILGTQASDDPNEAP